MFQYNLFKLPSCHFSCTIILDVSINCSPLSTLRWLWSPTTTPSILCLVPFLVTHLEKESNRIQTQWAAVRTSFLLISVPPQPPLCIYLLSLINLAIHGFEWGLTSHELGPPILPIGLIEFSLMQSSPSIKRSILSLLDYLFDLDINLQLEKSTIFKKKVCTVHSLVGIVTNGSDWWVITYCDSIWIPIHKIWNFNKTFIIFENASFGKIVSIAGWFNKF